MTRFTPIFLVLLRLAIGWHFFFEGVEKVQSPTWSSGPYLREATGPLAKDFRDLVGDPVLGLVELEPLPPDQDSARLPHQQRFPAALARAWDSYAERFIKHYNLNDEDAEGVRRKLKQRKQQTGMWLDGQGPNAEKKVTISKYGVSAETTTTLPQRLDQYKAAIQRLTDLQTLEQQAFQKTFEAQNVQALHRFLGDPSREATAAPPGLNAEIAKTKAEVTRQRAELLADINAQTLAMKKALRELLTLEQRQGALPKATVERIQKLPAEQRSEALAKLPAYGEFREEEDPSVQAGLSQAPVKNEDTLRDFLPELATPSWRDWSWLNWNRLQWADFLVRYGLLAVGACLLLGLLTRTSCVIGAAFLLLFYLAMPPLPGLPANPKAEGHYLYINKNIIEMLALLALATTYSGRWVGLDGLLHVLSPFRRRLRLSKPAKPQAAESQPKLTPQPVNGLAPLPLVAEDPAAPPESAPVSEPLPLFAEEPAGAASTTLNHPSSEE